MAFGIAGQLGAPVPFAKEYMAQNEPSFLRQRVKMFEADNPVFAEKAEKKGTSSFGASTGRTQYDPYRDRIQAGLLTGNVEQVNQALQDWLSRFSDAERVAANKGVRSSIQQSSPIKPGGSASLDSAMQFLDWAKQNLPEDEARKIFAQGQTYARTAMATGLYDKSKTLGELSQLDYDRFQPPKSLSPQVQAAQQAKAAAQHLLVRFFCAIPIRKWQHATGVREVSTTKSKRLRQNQQKAWCL